MLTEETPSAKTETPAEKTQESSLREGNISLILDNYEDIFSDFDPRPYTERAMSDDFLAECKRAVRDKTTKEGIELRLLVPDKLRKPAEEAKIKKRLKDHFQKHYNTKQKEQKTERKHGMLWFLAGVTLITASAMFYDKEGFLFSLIVVVLEPAGWFTTWSGLDKLFSKMLNKQPDIDFYEKMAKVEIKFHSY